MSQGHTKDGKNVSTAVMTGTKNSKIDMYNKKNQKNILIQGGALD